MQRYTLTITVNGKTHTLTNLTDLTLPLWIAKAEANDPEASWTVTEQAGMV